MIWVYVEQGTTHRVTSELVAKTMARRARRAQIATCVKTGKFPTRRTWFVDHYAMGTWCGRSTSHNPPDWLTEQSVNDAESGV